MAQAFVPASPRRNTLAILANTPWWLLSAGLHVVLLLTATLIYVETCSEVDAGAIEVRMHAASAIQVAELARSRDVAEVRGTPATEPVEIATDEPALFNPFARNSDHNESDDGEDDHRMKGQSLEFISTLQGDGCGIRGRSEGRNPGSFDTLGIGSGGGGAGRYGSRFGGRENLVRSGGGGTQSEESVISALRWLARHQDPDGGWSSADFAAKCFGKPCEGVGYNENSVAVTGLALLAFLGAGYTHLSRGQYTDEITGRTVRLGEVVKKGIRWLIAHQDADGGIGQKSAGKYMYLHSIATLGLCEAFGMTQSTLLKEPAQKAVDYLVAAKNPYKAWRYSPRCGENDTSNSGWCVMALKSAEISGLTVGRSTIEEAKQFFVEVTEPAYGRCGYQKAEDAGTKISVPGKNEEYANHETCTAVGMLVRCFVDHDRGDRVLDLGAALLTADLPRWDLEKKTNDYYYWYYGTLALFQVDGPDSGGSGKYWKPWINAVLAALLKNQRGPADGCEDGSWTTQERWSFEGGRVYTTALNALTLEVFYRYPNTFTGRDHRSAAKK